MSKKVKIGLSFAIVITLMVWITISGFEDNMQYYLEIKEVNAMGTDAQTQGLRVKGFLKEGSVVQPSNTSLERFFVIENEGHELKVRYDQEVPDTFKDGSEVLVEGKMVEAGYFDANFLMAKCPSKYESSDDYSEEEIKNYDPSTHSIEGTN